MRNRFRCAIVLLAVLLFCSCSAPNGSAPGEAASGLPPNVKSLIVPHADIALDMAAKAIAGLAGQTPKTVILLGPNHRAMLPKAGCVTLQKSEPGTFCGEKGRQRRPRLCRERNV